jgi:hypothetical protein
MKFNNLIKKELGILFVNIIYKKYLQKKCQKMPIFSFAKNVTLNDIKKQLR